jgi:hypothetical protein
MATNPLISPNPPKASTRPRAWATVALAVVALGATPPASAEKTATPLAGVPAQELKHLYLRCDAAATEALLDGESAALCSQVNEELMQRVFDGDFNRLLAWWRESKTLAAQARATSQD